MALYTEVPDIAALPRSDDMNNRWPLPLAVICGASSCASTIGARKFTSSARSISFDGEGIERARRRKRGIGDQDVDLARLSGQAGDVVGLGEVDGQRPRTELGGEFIEQVAASAGDDQPPPRSATAFAIAWPIPPEAPVSTTTDPEIRIGQSLEVR